MPKLSAKINRRNLYVEISPWRVKTWNCICFGVCEENTVVRVEDKIFDMSASHVTITFDTYEDNSAPSSEWKDSYSKAGGAIWIDFDSEENIHSINISILVENEIFDLVGKSDLDKNEIIVSIEYESMIEINSQTATAFATSRMIQFISTKT